MAVKTAESPQELQRKDAHAGQRAEVVKKFEEAFVEANGSANGIQVTAEVRKRLIEYFDGAVVPQLDDGTGVTVWEGPVQTFVLHCMWELARSVAADPRLIKEGITRELLDEHTTEHKPRWEKRCPMPPVVAAGTPPAEDPKLGPACVLLAAVLLV